MSTALISSEVKAVLNDLTHWRAEGVRIVIVEATPDGGVSVGVADDPAVAELALAQRYPFPVATWLFA